MIAVVTGSSGFIGSHLVDALLAQGATVRALVRDDSPQDGVDPRIARHRVDLLDDRSVRDAPVWEGATHVFHLAGVTKRRTLTQFREGNVVPTANLLAAAAARTEGARVVLVSSQAAAGPAPSPDQPLREDDPPHPIESYGRSKLEAERAATAYAERLPVTIVRPGAVYGPRDRDFLRAFRLAASRVQLHAVPREHRFSIVHVADLVDALLLAAERPEARGRTYFVAEDVAPSWRTLYAEVATAAGVNPLVELQLPLAAVAAAGLAGDLVSTLTGWHSLANRNKTRLARPPWWLCSSGRARSELGWSPQIPLQRGVRETYLWYLQAGWLRPPSRRASAISSERAPE